MAARADGRLTYANGTLERWTGRPRDELLSLRLDELFTTPGRLFYENQLLPILRLHGTAQAVALELVRAEGPPLPILLSAALTGVGDDAAIVAVALDATDRRSYERELLAARRHADRLAAVVTATSDAILLVGADCGILAWNPGATRMLGYAPGAVIGRDAGEIIPALGGAGRDALLARLRSGNADDLEAVAVAADGRPIDVSAALAPHLDLHGGLEAFSLILRDISARRAAERLQHEFVAMAGHELRNPLTVVLGQTQRLLRRGGDADAPLRVIEQQARLLERLIGDLLTASQVQAGHLELHPGRVDLGEVARTAAAPFLETEHPTTLDVDGPVTVWADSDRIGQVLHNLLSNAVKYSSPGSPIALRVWQDTEGHVSVTDRGVGIAPDAIGRVFERFYRAGAGPDRPRGLGLGLHVSQRIAEAHGGTIVVSSEPGRGSTFTLSLPLAQDAP